MTLKFGAKSNLMLDVIRDSVCVCAKAASKKQRRTQNAMQIHSSKSIYLSLQRLFVSRFALDLRKGMHMLMYALLYQVVKPQSATLNKTFS